MTFEETKRIIREFIESDQNIINEDQCKDLNEILKIIYEDLRSLSESGEFEDNAIAFRDILDAIVGISQIVLTGPLSNKFSTFIIAFSELVFNWNNNAYKDSTISVLVRFLTNTINSRNDTIKAVQYMKNAQDKIDVMTSWSPAAFDIAIAYVDEQLKINEEQKGVV